MANTCYAIVELDANGNSVRYLQFMEGWTANMPYRLTTNRAAAWRFPNKETAEEAAEVMNATSGSSLDVIGIDCDGPPLNIPPPPTM